MLGFGKKKKKETPPEAPVEVPFEDDEVVETVKPEKAEKKKKPLKKKNEPLGLSLTEEDGAKANFMALLLEQTERERISKLLTLSVFANVALGLLVAIVFYWAVIYKKDIYFATTQDGRIQELVPLSEPYVSIAGISNWTAQAITETYSLDFRNWRKSLAKVREYYSDAAWNEVEEEIEPLIRSIEKERLILYAVADEAPRLLHQGLYRKDLYAWKLEFPMTLTHQLADSTVTYNWLVQVLVGRANIAEKPYGVEIMQFKIRPL